jgi:hypothetical protein
MGDPNSLRAGCHVGRSKNESNPQTDKLTPWTDSRRKQPAVSVAARYKRQRKHQLTKPEAQAKDDSSAMPASSFACASGLNTGGFVSRQAKCATSKLAIQALISCGVY